MLPNVLTLRPLLTLAVALAALRTLVHFAVVGRIGDLSNLALLDVTALVLMLLAYAVVPSMGDYFGSMFVTVLATLLPLAGMGWLLETLASPHVSLLGAFMGMVGIGTGGVTGSSVRSIQFYIALPILAGGIYGLTQTHPIVLEVALLPAPYVLTAVVALAWRFRKPPRDEPAPSDF